MALRTEAAATVGALYSGVKSARSTCDVVAHRVRDAFVCETADLRHRARAWHGALGQVPTASRRSDGGSTQPWPVVFDGFRE